MRGYVERLEEAQYFMPENQEAGYDEVMDGYYEEVDAAKDKAKYEKTEED